MILKAQRNLQKPPKGDGTVRFHASEPEPPPEDIHVQKAEMREVS